MRYSTGFFLEQIVSSRCPRKETNERRFYMVLDSPFLIHENQSFEGTVTGQQINTWLDVYDQPEPSR